MALEYLSLPNPLRKCTFMVDCLTYLNQTTCLVSPSKDSLGLQQSYLPAYATEEWQAENTYYGVPDWYESPREDNWIDLSNNINSQTTFNWDSESFTHSTDEEDEMWYVDLTINLNGHGNAHPGIKDYVNFENENAIPSIGEPIDFFINGDEFMGLKDFSFSGDNPYRPILTTLFKGFDENMNEITSIARPSSSSGTIGLPNFNGIWNSLETDGSCFWAYSPYWNDQDVPNYINQIVIRIAYLNDPTGYSTIFKLGKFIIGKYFELSYYSEMDFTKSYGIESTDYISSPVSFHMSDPTHPLDNAFIKTFSQQSPGRRKWEIPYKNIKSDQLFAHNRGNKIVSHEDDLHRSFDSYVANEYGSDSNIASGDATTQSYNWRSGHLVVPRGEEEEVFSEANARDTLESAVLSLTLGSHLPYMFSPAPFGQTVNPSNIYLCRFDSESIEFAQTAGRSEASGNDSLHDFSLKFSETW